MLIKPTLQSLRKLLDSSEEGAAPLLGINGLVFIGHGRSDATAIKNAVRVAKQAAEAQLLSIMQDATKTQDVLDVYAQLAQVQSDIEVLQGQIKYYEQSAALSAISVTIIAEATVKPIKVAGWVPAGVARDALQSLIFFWQDFVDFLIRFFLYILPVLLTIGVPLYLFFLLVRWIFRRIRKPRPVLPVETAK